MSSPPSPSAQVQSPNVLNPPQPPFEAPWPEAYPAGLERLSLGVDIVEVVPAPGEQVVV